jgi:hypothetical protein
MNVDNLGDISKHVILSEAKDLRRQAGSCAAPEVLRGAQDDRGVSSRILPKFIKRFTCEKHLLASEVCSTNIIDIDAWK